MAKRVTAAAVVWRQLTDDDYREDIEAKIKLFIQAPEEACDSIDWIPHPRWQEPSPRPITLANLCLHKPGPPISAFSIDTVVTPDLAPLRYPESLQWNRSYAKCGLSQFRVSA